MKNFKIRFGRFFLCIVLMFALKANAQTPPTLGAASIYGILAADSIIVTDTIHVIGDAGAATFVHSKVVADNIYSSVSSAQSALASAKTYCSGLSGTSISGTLKNQSLSSGVYTISGNATLNDTMYLTGDTNDVYIFNISGDLTLNSKSVVIGIHSFGVRPKNVYWNVGGKTILNQYANFSGVVLSAGDININNMFLGNVCLLTQQTASFNGAQSFNKAGYNVGYLIYANDNFSSMSPGVPCSGPGISSCYEHVDNGGFEYIDPTFGCPSGFATGSWSVACPWEHNSLASFIPGTPDVFNSCASPGDEADVPLNWFGTQTPLGGSSYGGMFSGDTGPDNREGFIQDILPTSSGVLTAGKVYHVEFYVSLAESSAYASTMGFTLTDPSNNVYQIHSHPSIINSKTTWTKVESCITATGNESHIQIYNFTSTPWSFVGATPGYPSSTFYGFDYAYYYLDNVSVKRLANAGADVSTCSNATLTACAIPGATYLWTAADAFTATNSTITSPTSATSAVTTTINGTYTYTLTVTYAGCTDSDNVIVTNNSFNVTASATPNTINMGSTSSLSAVSVPSVGVTYSWSPGGMTGTPVIVSPVATTTYTVTATNSFGCTAQDTTKVNVIYPQCNISITYTCTTTVATTSTALFGATDPLVISNANIDVLSNLTINHANITFSNCNFRMAANTKIIINNNSTLNMNSKTHVYACGNMWDGIYLLGAPGSPSSFFIASGSAFIEDALNGIVSQNGSPYNLNTVIFNRNRIAVDVQTYTGVAYTGTIRNCIFTCRSIPSNANPASNYSVATLQGFLTPLTIFPVAKMKAPHSIELSVFGVRATSIPSIQIGLASVGTYNIFDALKCGISLTNSSATIYNNYFQNMINPYACTLACFSSLGGFGIKALGTVGGIYSIIIGGTSANMPNTFSNCYRGAYLEYYKTNSVRNNTFNNSFTGSGPAPYLGETGLFIRPANTSAITVTGNTITNCEDAITVNRVSSGTATAHTLQVNNNSITANASGKSTNAIYILDPSTAIPVGTPKEIKDNTIMEANYGINLSNVKQIGFTVATNSITARYASTGTQAGIRMLSCDKTIVNNNHTKYNVATAGLSGGNLTSYGIFTTMSTNMTIKCNLMEDAGRALAFSGPCGSTTAAGYGVTQNTMRRAREGFTLLASGAIGIQGTLTSPSGNIWDCSAGGYFTDCQTMANASNATGSVLHTVNYGPACPGWAVTKPSVNNFAAFGTAYLSGTSLINATGSLSSCGYVPAIILVDEESVEDEPVYEERDYSSDTININYLEEFANDTLSLPVYSDEVNWQVDQFTYHEISNDSLLLGSTDLQTFYTVQSTQPIGQFTSIDNFILDNNLSSANSANNSVTPTNTIEQNLKTYNNLILKLLIDSNYVYSNVEIDTLYYIAEQCPVEGGPAVASSRNLLMLILDDIIEFVDDCNEEPKSHTEQESTNLVKDVRFLIYPNPNNGNMTLNYSLKHAESGNAKIFDATGRLIANYNLNNDQKQLSIGGNNFGNGIYAVTVTINGKLVHTDKVIIIK